MSMATLTPEHKQSMAQGRREAAIVQRYLGALRNTGQNDVAEMIAKLEAIYPTGETQVDSTIRRRKAALVLAAASNGFEDLESAFIEMVADYSRRKGISFAWWRRHGVPSHVLYAAGVK